MVSLHGLEDLGFRVVQASRDTRVTRDTPNHINEISMCPHALSLPLSCAGRKPHGLRKSITLDLNPKPL